MCACKYTSVFINKPSFVAYIIIKNQEKGKNGTFPIVPYVQTAVIVSV